MLRNFTLGAGLLLIASSSAIAEVFEVEMLNRGDEGFMVFEPSSLNISVGDTVKFIAADRGHNAETIAGMVPEGAEGFSGKINEEIEIVFDVEGLYGIKCKPHFSMGMVMLVTVGEGPFEQGSFLEGRLPRKAKDRFETLLGS